VKPPRTSAMLPPAVAAVILIVFAVSGLLTGALSRGVIRSLGASATKSPPAATATHATATPRTGTANLGEDPTQAGPDQPFVLQISASPARVHAGAMITIAVVATTTEAGKPVAHLSCVLAAPRSGGRGLLDTWPAALPTDAKGMVSWNITVPSLPDGTYGVEVSANGAQHYSFWTYTNVYVSA
jgi:hypothetical protein